MLVEPGNEEQMADRHAVASGEGENIQIHSRSQPCKYVLHVQRLVRNKSRQSPYLCIIQVMLTMTCTSLRWMYSTRKDGHQRSDGLVPRRRCRRSQEK